jgi:TPR repeat protein
VLPRSLAQNLCFLAFIASCTAAYAGPAEDAKPAQQAYEKRDYAKSLALATPLAEAGNAVAQTILGFQYDSGSGVRQDPEQAVKWFKKSAAQGDALGQFGLGTMFDRGRGVERNPVEAVKYYRLAAVQGLALARMAIGRAYLNGDGVQKDEAEAITWYRDPAEEGYASAQLALGMAYITGRGVAQNQTTGISWLTRAAEQDETNAQLQLGMILLEDGTRDQEAVAWFRRAAILGSPDAQNALGQAYSFGRGVEKNQVLGLMWLELGAVPDFPEGIADRDAARKNLTPSQITQAETLAKQCRLVRYTNCAK